MYSLLAYTFQAEYIFLFSIKFLQLDHLISVNIHALKLRHVFFPVRMFDRVSYFQLTEIYSTKYK